MRKVVLLLLGCVLLFTADAQKVGVVLSGGGSSGIAHVGVLKALEENGIPIDYIAGTSMGALIGGMYAAGISPDEMYEIVRSRKFYDQAKGKIDENYKYYFKTTDSNPSWLKVRFEIDSNISVKIPTNIVSPDAMDIGLIENMSQAIAVANYDFDDLFVPFRCVAADVVAKEAVVFEDGDLCPALRSSFTYPLYMKPIEVDGRLLFDGGIYNNFPTDVVLEDFYPDIIIGSKVASEVTPPQDDDLMSQLRSLLMSRTDFGAVCENGIIIEPDIPDIPVMDFSRVEPLLEGGYHSTTERMEEIKSYITRVVPADSVQARRDTFNKRKPEFLIDAIHIEGLNRAQAAYVRNSLKQHKDIISFVEFEKAYFKLIADNKIKSIYPKVLYNTETGYYDLLLKIKRDNDIITEFGGNISSRSINQAFIALEYKFLGAFSVSVRANTHIGKFYTSGEFMTRFDFPFRLPFYFEGGITLNQWNYFDSFSTFFEITKPSYLIQTDRDVELNLALPLTTRMKLITGVSWANVNNEYYQTSDFDSEDVPDDANVNVFTANMRIERNTLNRKQYANEGRSYAIQARYVNGTEINIPGTTALDTETKEADHEWFVARANYQQYFNKRGRIKPGIFGEVVYSTQHFFSNYTSTLLMAPTFSPTPESKTLFLEEYRASKYAAFGLNFVLEITKRLDMRLESYVFHPLNKIKRNADMTAGYHPIRLDPRFMGTGGFVYNSPIGPISMSANYYDQETKPWSFLFHIGYIIFNRRALD